ncbi:alkaline phosphatase family protein [Ardenticatena maritima]|nr:alkaline phosphatase family protein [Ardenticatena maritima]KPL89413.1 hypothetical protein SE16_02885 [Ardenticatena maritima]
MNTQRLLIVGLDGATFDIIKPLAEAGRLPVLATLLQQGTHGVLQSVQPPITPTAWTTVFTGKNPGKHGIFDFQTFDPQTYATSPVRADRHREKRLWDLLTEADQPSIILDVPFTYPPRPFNGIMMTGYGTPRTAGTPFTWPPTLAEETPADLRAEIRLALPRHRFDRSMAIVEEWRDIMQGRRRLLRHLVRERDWALFFVVFGITDNLAHIFWTFADPLHPNYASEEGKRFREAFFQAYEQCDALLGDLLDWVGPETNVLIMSDHGFGSVYPRQYTFRRLVEGGFVRYKRAPLLAGVNEWAMRWAMRLYTSTPFFKELVKRLRPGQAKLVKQTLAAGGLLPTHSAIDPRRSLVLPSEFGLQLWLNRRGRFGHGMLDEDQAHETIARLREFLLADRDPITGKPIVRAIYEGRDLYHGAFAAQGPDIVLELTNFYDPTTRPSAHNGRIEGGHTPDGVFIAYGPAFRRGDVVAHATLADIAPTALYLLGHPIPPDMDGRVLTDALQPDVLEQTPIKRGETPATFGEIAGGPDFTPDEIRDIEQQLRQLGYID